MTSKQNNAHSELPWRQNPRATLNVETPKGRSIASCGGHTDGRIEDSGYSENITNAAFIVTACNQYYENKAFIGELVSALGGMVDRYTELVNCGDCGFWDPEEEDQVIAARAALSKAKEQQS